MYILTKLACDMTPDGRTENLLQTKENPTKLDRRIEENDGRRLRSRRQKPLAEINSEI